LFLKTKVGSKYKGQSTYYKCNRESLKLILFSRVANPTPTGLAYLSNVCQGRYKCAISSSKSMVSYVATAHEIGHK